jgi:hypothetical protein
LKFLNNKKEVAMNGSVDKTILAFAPSAPARKTISTKKAEAHQFTAHQTAHRLKTM